ncbi:MAG: fibronectin type III domain-containing protein [Gammaproteobacteria bacterium]
MLGIADDARAQDVTGISASDVTGSAQYPLLPAFSTAVTSYTVKVPLSVSAIQNLENVQLRVSGGNSVTIQVAAFPSDARTSTFFSARTALLPRTITVTTQIAGSTKTYAIVFIPSTAPAAPTLESPTVLSRSLALKWSAPTDTGGEDISGYKVRWAAESAPANYLSSGGEAGDDVPGGAAALSHTITALSDDIAYQVQVAAANTHGGGDWSAAQSATPATAAIKQALCITRQDAVVASFAQCKTIAAAGFSIPKSAGAQQLKITGYLFRPNTGDSFITIRRSQTDDPRNPLVAEDAEGVLPDLSGDWNILTHGISSASTNFTITPKASGDGGRINFAITPTGPSLNTEKRFTNLAPNELQGTFLQIVDADINFTEAASGACPSPNGGVASGLTLAEGGEAGILCVSLAGDPGAGAVSVGCVGALNVLGEAALDVTPGALSFASANWQAGQAVRLSARDNDNAGGASSAFALRCTATVSGAAGSVYSNLSNEFAVTLTDTDMVAASGTLAAGSISENGGAQMVEITATLGGGIASQTDCTVTVAIGTSALAAGDVLAVAPGDYTAFTPPPITITAGMLSGSAMVAVTPMVDSDADGESIPLSATASACGGTATVDFGTAEIVILDTGIRIADANMDGSCPAMPASDSGGIALEEGGAEDASGVLCVSLLGAPDSNVAVTCAGSASAGLFTAAPGALTFTADNYSTGQAVTLRAVDDNLSAPAADATDPLTCTATAAAASGYSGVSKAVTVTITDDTDTDTVSSTGATLSVTNVRKGTNDFARITATLGGDIAPLEDCTVQLEIESAAIAGTRADEVAVAGEDYARYSQPNITIAAGETSGSAEHFIDTADATDTDRQIESIPISGKSASCGGVTDLAFAAAEILLIHVQFAYSRANAAGACPATPGADVTSLALNEGESAAICVRLPADPAFDGVASPDLDRIRCSITRGDISLSPESFPGFTVGAGGTWKSGHAMTVTAMANDIAAGDQTAIFNCFSGVLAPAEPSGLARYGAHSQFSGSLSVPISEDDSVSTSGVLTADFAGESGGAQMVRITATLDGSARPVEDCAVTVTIGGSEISPTDGDALAASPGDYTGALTAPAISIAAGELSGSAMLAITPVVDADEDSESIPLAATAACGGMGSGADAMRPAHGSESVTFAMAEILIIDFDFAMLDGVDGAGAADGILVARYLAGVRGMALVAGLGLADEAGVAADAAASIGKNLPLLDVDGVNGTTMADGIMIARYYLGVTSGAGLYDGQADSMNEGTVTDNIMNNLAP